MKTKEELLQQCAEISQRAKDFKKELDKKQVKNKRFGF